MEIKIAVFSNPVGLGGRGVTAGDKILAPFTEVGESKANK